MNILQREMHDSRVQTIGDPAEVRTIERNGVGTVRPCAVCDVERFAPNFLILIKPVSLVPHLDHGGFGFCPASGRIVALS